MNKYNILIVDNDDTIMKTVTSFLEANEYHIIQAKNGNEAIKLLNSNINLIILNIMIPDTSGLQVCKHIRKKSIVPILFLADKLNESDKLIGFIAGGDDYLAKPFSHIELLIKIKSLLRRHYEYDKFENTLLPNLKLSEKENFLEIKNVKINTLINEVFINGNQIQLTEIEYRILLLFMKYPNKIFSIQNIYENVWNDTFYKSSSNTIMVHIRNLRSKIEKDPNNPSFLRTVWGKGYKIV